MILHFFKGLFDKILHFFRGQIKMSTHDLNLLYAQKFTVAENMKKYGGSFVQAPRQNFNYWAQEDNPHRIEIVGNIHEQKD